MTRGGAFSRALATAAALALQAVPAAPEVRAQGEPATLGELVAAIRDGAAGQAERLEQREQRFLEARDERAALLDAARRRRARAEAEADQLGAEFERRERELADLETALDQQAGNLRAVFAVVKQAAGDALPLVQNSLVSAQLGDRAQRAESLAEGRSVPSAEQLRGLWLLLLDEMLESGRVARFETPVISADGQQQTRRVTRIGTFAALSQGEYLRFLPETGRLLALSRQPPQARADDARAFETATTPLQPVAIDPSRGAILSLVVQTPGLRERVQQGGWIGYLILALGAVGLALALERLASILRAQHRLRRELADPAARRGGAVSALRSAVADRDYRADAEALSAKMDEIVATAAQRLRRGLPTLAIFAAVSPLLGLLGTVTGMIQTFQVITLFGAGDPRLMSDGISQALVTTQLGLSVAIPLLLVHSFALGRAQALIATLDQVAADLFADGRAHRASRADGIGAGPAEAPRAG